MMDHEEMPGGGTKKTKKLTQIDKQSDSGRRLVEYFVIISSEEHSPDEADAAAMKNGDMSFSEWKTETTVPHNEAEEAEDEFAAFSFRPVVTARYPLQDYPDNPLHENITFFCHPSGGIQLRTHEHMPKVHYFVATGGTGRQIYGTCLMLWEPYTLKIPKKTTKSESSKRNGKKEKNGEQQQEEREVYLPKCLVLLSTYPYLIAFREFLTQLNRLSKQGDMTLPIERYITNFCAEIPAPPPGSFEVQTTILDSNIKIWSPPHNLPIAWVSLPFSILFECLDIDNIILVWHCLVLERQVLITSTQLSIITTCCEIFLSLLFPMRWSHAYIPVLPHFLIPILSAPMPFLCGINKANLADALYDLSPDCVLVDLDKNVVTLGPETAPLPPLPAYQESVLRAHLDANAGMVFLEARSLTKDDDYSDSGSYLPMDVKLRAEGMWESKLCLFDEAFHLFFTPEGARKNHLNGNDASGMDLSDRDITSSMPIIGSDKRNLRKQSEWDSVQEAFLDTFVYLLRNYRKYLVFPSKHNEGSYGGAGFRSKEFIESQRYDMREFLEQLIGTQMFDNFITKRLYGSGEADVAFFDMAVDRFLKHAGMFADVNLSGRLLDASGFSKTSDRRGGHTNPKSRSKRTSKPSPSLVKKDVDPLLQSARVHRKLKTIVPPEPTGEALPPVPPILLENAIVVSTEEDDTSAYSSGSRRSRRSSLSNQTDSSPKTTVSMPKRAPNSSLKYTYKTFPSILNKDLFGNPRPLPSAVIAEFDRQRKDAAQFRRKAPRKPKESKKHFRHAHATVEPVTPPSPEAATFTVFFMAFTAMVGKELVDIALDSNPNDRTILSTYVPTTSDEADTDADSEIASVTGQTEEETVDEEEKARVAEMKTTRPSMGGMFGDEEEDEDSCNREDVRAEMGNNRGAAAAVQDVNTEVETASKSESDYESAVEDAASYCSTVGTAKSGDSKPRERFRDKLSDLQVEEAKVTGRAQLSLAFEMLTMMKKRAMKAEPETYQCLIDACGRVGDTKRATELLAKMHEDGIVADGTVYACLVSAFSAESAWKDGAEKDEELPEWANSTAVEMDWNKLQKRSLLDRIVGQVVDLDDEDEEENEEEMTTYQKLRNRLKARVNKEAAKGVGPQKAEDNRMEFYVTETVERQIALGENLLEIVFPDISIDTENEICPRCNFLLSDDDVAAGWTPDSNDYTTACSNCTQRFVPHFCVQCTAPTFIGSRGPASPLVCERLSPWVLQKEIRSVMAEDEGIDNLLSPSWREKEYKNAVLWWNLVLSCMRYRFPFSFLLQGSFDQNLIAPMPEDES